MNHGRRGLTVLSLLIILIVVAIMVFLLMRASSRTDNQLPGDGDVSTASVESAQLTTVQAPHSGFAPGASDTLTVQLTNSAGQPLVGVTIRFSVTEGAGVVAPGTVRADEDGTATTLWTYGDTEGTNSITISADVPNVRVEPLLFSVITTAAVQE